jgi:hypothetical protein
MEIGTTREHVIPKFFLNKDEEGITIPCCSNCQIKLKWLDDYASDYFRFHKKQDSPEEWEKEFKHAIIQNGSPMSLRYFGDEVVINEDILIRFVHKLCLGITFWLHGRLDNTVRLQIFTDFSKLGGYCQYNNENPSYSEEQTKQIEKSRNDNFYRIKNTINNYCSIVYQVKNAKVAFTSDQIVNGARWLSISLYNKFNIICAIVNNVSEDFLNARNMIMASFPSMIDTEELEKLRNNEKNIKRGDSISSILASSPTNKESRALRKKELLSLGITIEEIDSFEDSLFDFMENRNGKEKLAKMFLDEFKTKRRENKIFMRHL